MFDKEGTRSFKSLEAVKNFEEVYVQKYNFLSIENNFQKHAGVMALIAKTVYHTMVTLHNLFSLAFFGRI